MQDVPERDLLERFSRNESEEAFAELVRRHIALVYSVALRHTHEPQDAQDITQAVFIILARKAASLNRKTVLSGWLYHAARFTAANFQRAEFRRVRREQEIFMQSTIEQTPSDTAWRELAPLLEEAMARLGPTDRDAVVLCYFESKSLREAGAALGIEERAAQKRVMRALEKLRRVLTRRGVIMTSAAIAGAVSANSVQAVPAGLAATVAATAAKGAAAGGSTLTLVKGALKLMAWTKAKTAIVVGACVLLATGTATICIYQREAPVHGIPKDWSPLRGNSGQWSWADNRINGHSTTGDTILAATKKYGDVTVSAIASSTNRDAELVLRMRDADNGYLVLFVPDDTPWAAENGSCIKLMKKTSGDEVELGIFKRGGIGLPGHSAKITATAKGPWIEIFLNEDSILKAKDTTYSSGFIGLRVYGDPIKPCDAAFSNLTFY